MYTHLGLMPSFDDVWVIKKKKQLEFKPKQKIKGREMQIAYDYSRGIK